LTTTHPSARSPIANVAASRGSSSTTRTFIAHRQC
jgi:hypothetical protein